MRPHALTDSGTTSFIRCGGAGEPLSDDRAGRPASP